MTFHLKHLISIIALWLISGSLLAQQSPWLTSQYWKDQLFTDIMPYWTKSFVDENHQSFHTSMDESWHPVPVDSLRYPSMIARHLFSYSAAFMLSGEREYVEMAHRLKNYLVAYCYDKEYGGWYNAVSPDGRVLDAEKSSFVQFYVITGLTLYYSITKDPEVYSLITSSNDLMESKVWDAEAGGYYNSMNRDWTVADDRKSFSPQLAPISGYLLYLYLSTRQEGYLDQIMRIVDTVAERMIDPNTGWVLEDFTREWEYVSSRPEPNEINIGHTIEVVWVLARLRKITESEDHSAIFEALNRLNGKYGFNEEIGFWYAEVGRERKELHAPFTHWWIQAYGMMNDLVLWALSKDENYLKRFEHAGTVWETYFLDQETGDTPLTVGLKGEVINGHKANQFKSSYHNAELAFLNYLYLKVYKEKAPFSLYFFLSNTKEELVLHPLPIEAKDFSISGVLIDGKPVNLPNDGTFGVKIPPMAEGSILETVIQPSK